MRRANGTQSAVCKKRSCAIKLMRKTRWRTKVWSQFNYRQKIYEICSKKLGMLVYLTKLWWHTYYVNLQMTG